MRSLRAMIFPMIFADPMSALNPLHTVGNQIAEVIELHNPGMKHEEVEKKVDEMMELVGIPAERKTEYPHQFSAACARESSSLSPFPATLVFCWPTSPPRPWT